MLVLLIYGGLSVIREGLGTGNCLLASTGDYFSYLVAAFLVCLILAMRGIDENFFASTGVCRCEVRKAIRDNFLACQDVMHHISVQGVLLQLLLPHRLGRCERPVELM